VNTKKKKPLRSPSKPAASRRVRSAEHPNDPALSTLLARQEHLHVALEKILGKFRTGPHPSDPALSAGLGRLSTLEDKLDRLLVAIDGIVKRQKSPNPNDPALSVVLARIEGLEHRLERIAGIQEKGGARPARAALSGAGTQTQGAAPAPAGDSAASAAGVDTAQFLARTPLFAKLSAMECGVLAGFLEAQSLASGGVLFKQDDFGDAMYVVKTGLLEIYKNDVFGAVRVAEVRPGGLVGEMALVENKPRSANVRASEDCQLLLFSRGAYAQLKEKHPQVATKFQDELLLLLSGRLRQTTDKLVGKN
jgi:CRP/FNR family transcriptional regulator, cyclic AMP receptor protein